MSNEDAYVVFAVHVGEVHYEMRAVGRADVVEIRDPPSGVSGMDALNHATVVTRHATYVVCSGVRDIAARVWPAKPFCRECKRAL